MDQPLLETDGLIRVDELAKKLAMGQSTIWKRAKEGTFPQPCKLGLRTVAWRTNDINEWLNNLEAWKMGGASHAA